LAIELQLDNGYSLELIFEKINDRIKILINKKNPTFKASVDNNNDSINNKKCILPYIKKISELISQSIKQNLSWITEF